MRRTWMLEPCWACVEDMGLERTLIYSNMILQSNNFRKMILTEMLLQNHWIGVLFPRFQLCRWIVLS